MSRSRNTQVGLDRLVRIAWLEKIAQMMLAGIKAEDIKVILQDDLAGQFPSSRRDVRGSLDKTITILKKVWLAVPPELDALRMEGLKLLSAPTSSLYRSHYHLAIHWGMVMAVYPFWFGVALQVGRLLRLQGSVTASQVQRRVSEQYGERETVSRRARYVLRSYLDWGVLQESGTRGIYSAGLPLAIDDTRLIAWLVEASLHGRPDGAAVLKDLLESPGFFPFQLKPLHTQNLLAVSSRIEIHRHGLDDDLVLLRKQTQVGKQN